MNDDGGAPGGGVGSALRASEATVDALLGALTEAVVLLGPDGAVAGINDAARRELGHAIRELTDASWQAQHRIVRGDGSAFPVEEQPALVALRVGRVVRDVEMGIAAPDGRLRWFLAGARQVRDANDRVLGAVASFVDITERKRTEARTSEVEGLFRAAFEVSSVGVGLIEPRTGQVVRVNRRLCEMVGVEEAELVGRSCAGIIHPADRETSLAEFLLLGQGDLAECRAVMRFTRKDGGVLWADVIASLVRDPEQRPSLALVMVQDITAFKRSEAALREADRRKDEFLAMLSHELRNPLAAIRSAFYLLVHAPPNEGRRLQAQGVVDRQLTQLTRLVDDLLDVTRISRGKFQVERQRLDVGDLVRRVLEDQHALFAERGIWLAGQIEGEPLWILGDTTRLAQVVANLLSNAAKFTVRGGRVDVSLARTGEEVVLRVRDTGSGIAPEVLPHIFEPFMQAEATLDRALDGLGLGLALVKSIVGFHGGSVAATSAGVGQGTEMTVRLPLEATAESGDRPAVTPALPKRRRVLVVEDNRDIAEMLQGVLQLLGHEVRVALDGPSGLAAGRELRPDLVLCDIGLPGMTGYEVARHMREDEAFRGALLVALSGYGQAEDRRRTADAGFARHVVKPITLAELRRLLDGEGSGQA